MFAQSGRLALGARGRRQLVAGMGSAKSTAANEKSWWRSWACGAAVRCCRKVSPHGATAAVAYLADVDTTIFTQTVPAAFVENFPADFRGTRLEGITKAQGKAPKPCRISAASWTTSRSMPS